jgi:hypothetical protein
MARIGRKRRDEPEPAVEQCAHEQLMPRWRGPEVMDDESRAMGYVCHACQAEFLPYQVRGRRLASREHGAE